MLNDKEKHHKRFYEMLDIQALQGMHCEVSRLLGLKETTTMAIHVFSTGRRGEGQGAGCLCDPLALWE